VSFYLTVGNQYLLKFAWQDSLLNKKHDDDDDDDEIVYFGVR